MWLGRNITGIINYNVQYITIFLCKETMIFYSLQELSARLFTKLTQEGSTLRNPVVLRLFGRQMDKTTKFVECPPKEKLDMFYMI